LFFWKSFRVLIDGGRGFGVGGCLFEILPWEVFEILLWEVFEILLWEVFEILPWSVGTQTTEWDSVYFLDTPQGPPNLDTSTPRHIPGSLTSDSTLVPNELILGFKMSYQNGSGYHTSC
jgi:hypothetical protein